MRACVRVIILISFPDFSSEKAHTCASRSSRRASFSDEFIFFSSLSLSQREYVYDLCVCATLHILIVLCTVSNITFKLEFFNVISIFFSFPFVHSFVRAFLFRFLCMKFSLCIANNFSILGWVFCSLATCYGTLQFKELLLEKFQLLQFKAQPKSERIQTIITFSMPLFNHKQYLAHKTWNCLIENVAQLCFEKANASVFNSILTAIRLDALQMMIHFVESVSITFQTLYWFFRKCFISCECI